MILGKHKMSVTSNITRVGYIPSMEKPGKPFYNQIDYVLANNRFMKMVTNSHKYNLLVAKCLMLLAKRKTENQERTDHSSINPLSNRRKGGKCPRHGRTTLQKISNYGTMVRR